MITRRDLLKTATVAATGSLFFSMPEEALAGTRKEKSKVVLIRREDLMDAEGKPKKDVARAMLDEALCKLTGKKTADKAWKSIIKADDVVGIKTNEWKNLPTPAVLEELLKEATLGVGVKEADVCVRDRGVLSDPVFKRATALINIRPMRTHAWSGVGTLMKNYIMFSPKPSSYHDDSCVGLAKLFDLPEVKGKTRLNILVMFTPQFQHNAANSFSPDFVWAYNGLIVGFDPVACDATGLRIIEAKRKAHFGEYKPLNPPAKHIAAADTTYHLGNADPANIELIKLGWDKESFV